MNDRDVRLDEDVLAAVTRRAPGGDVAGFVNGVLRRHLGVAGAGGGDAARFRAGYLDALIARDAPRALTIAEEALAAGVTVADLYAEVLTPALREVGHRWALDEISVAQEHYATSVTLSLIEQLAVDPGAGGDTGRLAIVAGTPDELHRVGARMVADVLRREGWEVLDLGAATPTEALVDLVAAELPDLVALSAATAGRLPGVSEVLRALAGLEPRPLIAVGGALFGGDAAAMARELGADLVLDDPRALVAELRRRF